MSSQYEQLNDIRDAVEGILGLMQEVLKPRVQTVQAEFVGRGDPLAEVRFAMEAQVTASQQVRDFQHVLAGTLNTIGKTVDEIGRRMDAIEKDLKQFRHVSIQTRDEATRLGTQLGTLRGAVRQLGEKIDANRS